MEFSQQERAYKATALLHGEALKYNKIFDIVKPEIESTLSDIGATELTQDVLRSASTEFVCTLHSFKLLFGEHPLGISLDYNDNVNDRNGTASVKESHSLIPSIIDEKTGDESLKIFAQKVISRSALREIMIEDKARRYTLYDMKGTTLELDEKDELFYSHLGSPRANSDAEKNVVNNLSSVRHYYATELALAGRSAEIINLLKTGDIDSGSVHNSYGILDQDTLIQVIKMHPEKEKIIKGYELSRVLDGMKRITDPDSILELFVEKNAENFSYLDERERERVLKSANNLSEALNSEPVISELAPLSIEGKNKFIMGVQTSNEGPKIFVTWSSQEANSRHKSQLRKHALLEKVNVDPLSVSGGYIDVKENESGELELVFNSSSGDYGKYSKRMLEKFSEELKAKLSKCLDDKEVILIIE